MAGHGRQNPISMLRDYARSSELFDVFDNVGEESRDVFHLEERWRCSKRDTFLRRDSELEP